MKRIWSVVAVVAAFAAHEANRGFSLLAQGAGGGVDRGLGLCTGSAVPTALEYLNGQDPVAEACEASAALASAQGDALHAAEYRRMACSRGRTGSCVSLADALVQEHRLSDAVSLLKDPAGPCSHVPYSDGHAGYQGKECDEKLVDLLKGAGEQASFARRLCVEGHEERYCQMTQQPGTGGSRMLARVRAKAEEDRAATLARQKEEAAERSAEYGWPSSEDSEAECRRPIQSPVSWSPTNFVDVVPNVWLGCAASIEDRCSRQQTVELWIWNRNEKPVSVEFNWSLDANVLVEGRTIIAPSLGTGIRGLFASVRLEYAHPELTVRARATRCVFRDVRVGGSADGALPGAKSPIVWGDYQDVRVSLPASPVAPDALSEDGR